MLLNQYCMTAILAGVDHDQEPVHSSLPKLELAEPKQKPFTARLPTNLENECVKARRLTRAAASLGLSRQRHALQPLLAS